MRGVRLGGRGGVEWSGQVQQQWQGAGRSRGRVE